MSRSVWWGTSCVGQVCCVWAVVRYWGPACGPHTTAEQAAYAALWGKATQCSCAQGPRLCGVLLCRAVQVCAMLVECLELRRKWLFRAELQPEQRRVSEPSLQTAPPKDLHLVVLNGSNGAVLAAV